MPLVSVLIPVRNGGSRLGQAIDSVLAQTFQDFEVVVVDDRSEDGTAGVVAGFARSDPRVRLESLTGGCGLVAALNFGLRCCRGRFVARLDSDDVMMPNRLAQQLEVLNADRIVLVGSNVEFFAEHDYKPTHSRLPRTQRGVVKWLVSGRSPFAHPAVTFRRDAVIAIGGYSHSFPHAEDFDLWCRLRSEGLLVNLPQVLTRYRIHEGQVSQIHAFHQQLSTLKATRGHFPNSCGVLGHVKNGLLTDSDMSILASILRGTSVSAVDLKSARPELVLLEQFATSFRHGWRDFFQVLFSKTVAEPRMASLAVLRASPYFRRSALRALRTT